MILYTENPKEPKDKLLEITSGFVRNDLKHNRRHHFIATKTYKILRNKLYQKMYKTFMQKIIKFHWKVLKET